MPDHEARIREPEGARRGYVFPSLQREHLGAYLAAGLEPAGESENQDNGNEAGTFEYCDHYQEQKESRDGEEGIDRSHQDRIDNSFRETGHQPDDRAYYQGDQD